MAAPTHRFNPPETVALSDEQFAKIVELLTPGYELAKMYLAAEAAKPTLRQLPDWTPTQ